jgi:predicted TIM-barrel fold metal-dependent hydrolase
MIGDLEPGKPDFRKQLDRFHRNPLYLGIRYGNLWGRDFSAETKKPECIADLKELAAAGLTMDSANPDPALLADLLRVTDRVPNLRVVIDHLPQLNPPTDAAALRAYRHDLQEFAKRPQVYVKISEVLRRVDGKVPEDVGFYRPRLDELFGVFGEDRVVYGSDWPNSDTWLTYPHVLKLVSEYFNGKGHAIAEKYFWKNSVAAYRWVKRDAGQPQLA